MSSKKKFEISNSLAQALEETISAAKNYSSDLNIDIIPLSKVELDQDNPRDLAITLEDMVTGITKSDLNYERKTKEKTDLETLVHSIKKQGVLNPVIVYKAGDKYRLVAGERRTLASILAGKKDIQARLLEGKPSQLNLGMLQWFENVERKNLSLWARLQNLEKILTAIKKEKKINNITPTEIGDIIGGSLQLATNYKVVLDASIKIKMLIQNDKIKNLEKAALISRASKEIQDELISACLDGATLKNLKKLARNKSSIFENEKSKSRGRKPAYVNFGLTKNVLVAKNIIDILLANDKFTHLKKNFFKVNWNDCGALSKIFRLIIQTIEHKIQ